MVGQKRGHLHVSWHSLSGPSITLTHGVCPVALIPILAGHVGRAPCDLGAVCFFFFRGNLRARAHLKLLLRRTLCPHMLMIKELL